jgi:flagellin-specific chaperone FliS
MEANSQQSDQQLQEVETLLNTLLDGWQQVTAQHSTPPVRPVAAYPAPVEEHRERLSLTY